MTAEQILDEIAYIDSRIKYWKEQKDFGAGPYLIKIHEQEKRLLQIKLEDEHLMSIIDQTE